MNFNYNKYRPDECRECDKPLTHEDYYKGNGRHCLECLKEFAKQGVDNK